MITPLLDEEGWAPLLNGSTGWEPVDAPMVVVAPHPDDETLAAGGLIAAQRTRGVELTIIAVTDGENAYEQNNGLAELRREEQVSALARLGVPRQNVIRLGLVDSDVTGEEEELIKRLRPFITDKTQVVAPWSGDFHPDHEACGRAAEIVAREARATLISYFFWTWHRGSVASLQELKLQKFTLTKEMMIAKREALACHASQLEHAPEQPILPANLLWPAWMPFEVFAL
jgi:LmbE family N-acetylglucosaminyl deacetylase